MSATSEDGRGSKKMTMTNYERFFGTPEKTAETLANTRKLTKSLNAWAGGDGALLASLVGRGNGKTARMVNAYTVWLNNAPDVL